MKPRRARTWILTIALALATGELVARKYIAGPVDFLRPSADPVLGYELKPGTYETDGYFLRTPAVDYHIDADGCRRWGGAPGARPDVLYVGSSLIFGIGVRNEETIPYLVSEALKQRSPSLPVTSVNCAVPGYNVEQSLHSAAQHVAIDKPRLLVVLLAKAHLLMPFDWSTVAPKSAFVRFSTANSRLARVIFLYWLIKSNNSFTLPPITDEAIDRGLAEMTAAIEKAGTRVVFFPTGMRPEERPDVREKLRARSLAFLDLEKPEKTPAYFLADHEHWNLAGNKLVADQMVNAIAQALSSPPLPEKP